MYLWNVDRLVEDFREGRVTERQQLPYLMLFAVATMLVADPYFNSLLSHESISAYDMVMLPANLVIVIVGTIFCYQSSSKSGSGPGFIARYICIGWPVFIRLTVSLVAAFILLVVANLVTGTMGFIENRMELISVVITVGFEFAYFWYLARSIRASYPGG